MKIFAVGPVPMDPETLATASLQLPYFRTEEFSEMLLECADGLKQLIGTSDDSRVVFLASSGTGAMEATVINLFNQDDRVLIIAGGTFGKRFRLLCEVHGIPFESIDLGYGEALTRKKLEAYRDRPFTGMLVNIHETLTGQLYDMDMLSGFCKDKGMMLVVDAISTFLVDDYDMDASGVACTIISSQKGLALHPGLSMVIVNQEAYDTRVPRSHSPSLYFRFPDYYPEVLRGQTPYTPSIGIIMQLQEKLRRVRARGVRYYIDDCARIAARVREGVLSLGYRIPDAYPLSNGVTPVIDPSGNAYRTVKRLKDEFGIFVIPSAGALTDTVFRIGHMGGNISDEDVDMLIDAMRRIRTS